MGKNSLRGTTTCYVKNNRADERFRPKEAGLYRRKAQTYALLKKGGKGSRGQNPN